jgi:hypothetical protein
VCVYLSTSPSVTCECWYMYFKYDKLKTAEALLSHRITPISTHLTFPSRTHCMTHPPNFMPNAGPRNQWRVNPTDETNRQFSVMDAMPQYMQPVRSKPLCAPAHFPFVN